MKIKPHVPIPEFPRSFETFKRPGSWEQIRLEEKSPCCFEGDVQIKKYRVTFESIEEPKDVLIARLRKLWAECENHHHWAPLRAQASKLGVDLKFEDLKRHKKAAG